MALEAVVLSQQSQSQQGSRFGCGAMAAGGPWSGLLCSGMEGVLEMGSGAGGGRDVAACSPPQLLQEPAARALPVAVASVGSASGGAGQDAPAALAVAATAAAGTGRRKRRRMRPQKNEEEVESQRMVHIAVERNRRKQMNEYLAALRSLMPPAYTQRGDQASIVGGAINFVKELEQLLQSLEAQMRSSRRQRPASYVVDPDDAGPFADFFTFPQYSMCAAAAAAPENTGADAEQEEASGSKPSAVADVEATMVESHANLRVLSRRRPRQLLRLVLGLQGHRLTVLHLNMSSAGHMVLYSFSLKVEDDCPLTSVDEIAGAAHQIVQKINEEQGGSCLE